jgi:hypothetical protein
VLSKETIKRLIAVGFPDKKKCSPQDIGFEDLELGLFKN